MSMANIGTEGWQECLSWVHALCIAFESCAGGMGYIYLLEGQQGSVIPADLEGQVAWLSRPVCRSERLHIYIYTCIYYSEALRSLQREYI